MYFWVIVIVGYIIYTIYSSTKDKSQTKATYHSPENTDNRTLLDIAKEQNQRKWNFEPKEVDNIPIGNKTITTLKKYIEDNQTIKIKYRAANGYLSTRNIRPLKITGWGGQYYLKAFCLLKNEERTFKIDRIEAINEEEILSKKNETTESFSNKKILIVEADVSLAKTYQTILKKNRAIVKILPDGISALENLKNNDYDFIYLNLSIPFANGIEVLRNIKKRKLSDSPVVIFTNTKDDKSKAEIQRLGADGYFEYKDSNPDEVISAIEPFLIKES